MHALAQWKATLGLAAMVGMMLPSVLLSSALAGPADSRTPPMKDSAPLPGATELATMGGGCFWCIEAVFEMLPGVVGVTSGYAGGAKPDPTYKEVCSGTTGHAEVVQIEFDPQKIAYERLLEVFWEAHDPTTLNRQGPDVGTQYRSVIFYHTEAQRIAAEQSKQTAAARFKSRIVTELKPLPKFYPAEGYHQDYFRNNANYPYCRVVIQPKVDKFKKKLGTAKP